MNSIDSSYIKRFFQQESAAGILLMVTALLAILVANSPLDHWYDKLMDTPVSIQVGALIIAKPLLLWVNDGLMAVFFLFVGLELKREVVEGELSDKRNMILPGLGAIGGMVVPSVIYIVLNSHDKTYLDGWAIPAATDIAFALGILTLLGDRVPTSLKVFLTSLAIFDDVGAIVIIALFYNDQLSLVALVVAAVCLLVLAYLNYRQVMAKSMYLFVGLIMWVGLLKSGVHATLAGVILAIFIPINSKDNPEESPLKELEHDLHSAVAFFILPIFAFFNAGLNLSGVGLEQITHSVPLGIILGLVVGKQLGIFGLCWLGVKLKWAELPKGMNLGSLYGVAALCGIGFTMSLFIGSLAFEETGVNLLFDERLGILIGSIVSGVIGYLVLNKTLSKQPS